MVKCLILVLSIWGLLSATEGQWYHNLNVWEGVFPGKKGWGKSKRMVGECKGGAVDGVYSYRGSCFKYLSCEWKYENYAHLRPEWLFYVTLLTCPMCYPGHCLPTGQQFFNPNTKKCDFPERYTPQEHRCGSKVPPPPPKPTEKKCEAPPDSDGVHRLGTTRFFVLQNEAKSNQVNWEGAKEACQKLNLKLAKIDDLQTEVSVRKELEKFIIPRGWIDNWYWMDGKFDRALGTYVWQDTMEPIKFSNFYYRAPRPKGYGDFFDNEGNYVAEPVVEHCLAQSMPTRFPQSEYPDFREFHTSWWERECSSSKKGNVLCETADPLCLTERDESIFSEKTGLYYKEFWPMSNRRFVVMWEPKSYEEAKAICEEHRMTLYKPDKEDSCLAQNLKNWMKSVTSYAFWTDVRYKTEERLFVYPDGKQVPKEAQKYRKRITKRDAGAGIPETCASITWNYEDHPANPNFCNCTSKSIDLSPENCKNRIGVICQPRVEVLGECTNKYYEKPGNGTQFMKFNMKLVSYKKIEEYYPFNDDPDWEGGIIRSAYKQDGRSGQCPPEYQRVTRDDSYWGTEDDFLRSKHPYDFLTTYWMKPKNETCSLSIVKFDSEQKKLIRELTDGDCSAWSGFVLCKKRLPKTTTEEPHFQGRKMDKSRRMLDFEDLTVREPA